jgi:hypothetical protein
LAEALDAAYCRATKRAEIDRAEFGAKRSLVLASAQKGHRFEFFSGKIADQGSRR